MRKLFTATILLACASISQVFGQGSPTEVTITKGEVTTNSITCSFTKGSEVAKYHIVLGQEEQFQQWTQMLGKTVDELIEMWSGGAKENDTTHTWKNLTPNTPFSVYVLAIRSDGTKILPYQTFACPTLSIGGTGVAKQTIEISEITSTGAKVTVTANSETSDFRDLLATDSLYKAIGLDSLVSLTKEDPYKQYEKDEFVWNNLQTDTKYHVIAVGRNINEEWGEITTTTFRTLASTTLLENIYSSKEIKVFPMPNNGNFTVVVETSNANATVDVIDIRGNVVLSKPMPNTTLTISKTGLPKGIYLIRYISTDKKILTKMVVN